MTTEELKAQPDCPQWFKDIDFDKIETFLKSPEGIQAIRDIQEKLNIEDMKERERMRQWIADHPNYLQEPFTI